MRDGGRLPRLRVATPTGWRHAALCVALLAALGWLLGGGEPTAWLVGVPTVAAATLASLWLSPGPTPGRRLASTLRFAPFVLCESLRSGIAVARAALAPRLRLAPGLMEYPLRLRGTPAVFLANASSLLPCR
jgi:multicomponent Na+:H+ antiporter subunit E